MKTKATITYISDAYFSIQPNLFMFIYVISVFALLCFCARLSIVALLSPAEKELTSWLSLAMSNCEVVTFLLVSWVRCGA